MSKRLFLATLTALSTLGIAELFLRCCAPVAYRRPVPPTTSALYRVSDVPGLEYEHVPGAVARMPAGYDVHLNRHGLRNPEVPQSKPAGVLRIGAVGDSFTFGEGVGDMQTYPWLLQAALRRLSAGPERVEVLNFGVTGYSTADEAVLLRARVLAFEPDLILLGYVLNDPDAHPANPLHLRWHEAAWWERFELTRLVAGIVHDRERRRLGYDADQYFELLHDPRAGYWQVVVDGFAEIGALARGAGVPVVVVIFPLITGRTWERYTFDPIHAQVRRLAEANGFGVLDLKQALAGRAEVPRDLKLDEDDHASPRGNRAFARVTAEFLEAEVLPRLRD